MIHESIKWAAQAMHGQLHGTDVPFTGVSTDTRALRRGEIFFCLMGSRDGHEFIGQAVSQSAAAVVIDKNHVGSDMARRASTTIVVEDTLHALGDLAHAWRKRFSIPIVAIAGSNGKTTTKELTRSVLSTRYRVLATEGNLNNLIGVPKTLFRLSAEQEVAVVEVGMNDFGELARLTEIVSPNAGLITNVGMEHLEKLGDLEGVARAEGELFAHLTPEATALVNQLDPYVGVMPTPAKKIFYGTPGSAVWGEVLRAELQGERPLLLRASTNTETVEISLRLPGAHNLSNVLAALAVGRHLNVSLAEAGRALEEFHPAASRMQMVELNGGRRMIDDCYNANPSSTIAALKTLSQIKGQDQAMAILGEMLELGAYTLEGHRQVGRMVGEEKIDFLLAIGKHAREIREGAEACGMAPASIRDFSDPEAAIAKLLSLPEKVRWLLVKGSRGIHLEKIVNYIKEHF